MGSQGQGQGLLFPLLDGGVHRAGTPCGNPGEGLDSSHTLSRTLDSTRDHPEAGHPRQSSSFFLGSLSPARSFCSKSKRQGLQRCNGD